MNCFFLSYCILSAAFHSLPAKSLSSLILICSEIRPSPSTAVGPLNVNMHMVTRWVFNLCLPAFHHGFHQITAGYEHGVMREWNSTALVSDTLFLTQYSAGSSIQI